MSFSFVYIYIVPHDLCIKFIVFFLLTVFLSLVVESRKGFFLLSYVHIITSHSNMVLWNWKCNIIFYKYEILIYVIDDWFLSVCHWIWWWDLINYNGWLPKIFDCIYNNPVGLKWTMIILCEVQLKIGLVDCLLPKVKVLLLC